ncbi:MAG: site-2 protease family protein [Gammaproteobacteria bacterium]|nr:site-2 protease family protein [Gammaproteobacteria bacterium]MDH5512076.1 site-2 protease family protein [Gammaproteobacteria bacterium]
MPPLSLPQLVAVAILPLLFAITVHEVAHGWVAKLYGDPTAQRLGRLTLNPLKHIDPVGTILVPGLLLMLGGFVFGWAKPVPVTWQNLRNPKRDMAIVAAAGPAANLLMAVFWAVIAKIGMLLGTSSWAGLPMQYMGIFGIQINAILMILNLLPLPPLDGGRVAVGLLPGPWAWRLSRVEPFGFFILLALLATGMLGILIGPPIRGFEHLISFLVGLR